MIADSAKAEGKHVFDYAGWFMKGGDKKIKKCFYLFVKIK